VSEREDQRDRWNEALEGVSCSDGCNSCLLAIILPIVLVILVWAEWTLFTTPSPPPFKWDPSYGQIPGNESFSPRPTPIPSKTWTTW